MKVLRLLPELDFGGVESRLQIQAELHDRSAYELRVCAFHKPGAAAARLRELGIQVDVLNVPPLARNPRATLSLARYLRGLRPDVVHASIAEANFHSLLAGPLAATPLVITEETGMPSHGATARLAYRLAYRAADAIVGVSQAVCDYVRDVDRAPAERVRLIYNCAAPAYFPESPSRSAPAPGSPLTLILVSRLVPVKNHLFFLRVLAHALPSDRSVLVKIVGDGPLQGEIQAELVRLGLADRVELTGVRSDVRELLLGADIYALPSESEGCSVSLIEAMASGLHAIGSDVAGIREVLGPFAADWTAPPRAFEAWVELVKRALAVPPSERRRLADTSRRRAYSQFSPESYVKRLQAMYFELAAQRRSHPRWREGLGTLFDSGASS